MLRIPQCSLIYPGHAHWCDVNETTIQFQTDGRRGSPVQNGIGYFACPIYLCIKCLPGDSFMDLLQKVTFEYCDAYEHADFSYFESQLPRPGFTVNSCFNWVPNGSGLELLPSVGSEDAITFSPVSFEHPMSRTLERDHEPSMLLFDADDHIDAGVTFRSIDFLWVRWRGLGRISGCF